MAKISIVVPVYNEEENIHELYSRLTSALKKDFADFEYELIFIDDGSRDSSVEKLEKLHQENNRVKIIEFSRNFGHHIAITAGLDHADGDFVVMMDGDLQDQPEEIIKLYRKLEAGHDVVYAERVNKQFNPFRKFCSAGFNWVIKRLIREKIVINSTIFRIMRKDVVMAIRKVKEQNRYVIGIIGWVGFNHAPQPVAHAKRHKGKSKYNFSKQITLALNAIFSFSDYPLRLIVKIGFAFVFFSVILTSYQIYLKFSYGVPVLGWTSLISAILIVGGVQIILLGVIGAYLGRNYMETKGRPLYVVRRVVE